MPADPGVYEEPLMAHTVRRRHRGAFPKARDFQRRLFPAPWQDSWDEEALESPWSRSETHGFQTWDEQGEGS